MSNYAEKRAMMERILAAWAMVPDQWLGQFLSNAGALSYNTDELLIQEVEAYAKFRSSEDRK